MRKVIEITEEWEREEREYKAAKRNTLIKAIKTRDIHLLIKVCNVILSDNRKKLSEYFINKI